MSRSEAFVYESLPEDGESVRLLRIPPGSGSSGVLRCELSHATIKDEYTALSYTWGPPGQELEVQVNNSTLLVRRNLWEFLIRVSVSPEYAAQTFWIDAVCINQKDDREKSFQVAQMGKIYESAHHVLIWLAPQDAQNVSLDVPRLPISHFKDMTQCLFEQGKIQLCPESEAKTTCSTFISDRYLRNLINKHDYWRRLWIVQEFLLNKERTILYGSLAVPWEIFAVSQKHYEIERRHRGRALSPDSSSLWWESPGSLLTFVVSQWQPFTGYIRREQTRFATQNGLPTPSPAGPVPTTSLSDFIVRSIGRYAPKILANIVEWRTDVIQPSLPSMAEILQRRTEGSTEPRLPTKSAFSLFLQDLAEMQCFDRRDKIYGLTALADDKHPFPIDYSIDACELYFQALQFFMHSKEFSTEPCTLAPESLACGLLDVLKIPLSDLAKKDSKKRSANYIFVAGANSDTNESITDAAPPSRDTNEVSTPKYKNVEHVFQTFEDCLQIPVHKGQELKIPCPHCSTTTTFHAATSLKLQVSTKILLDDPKEPLVAVLQCLIPNPTVASNVQHGPHSLGNEDDDMAFQHLLLFYESQSGRPDALLNLEGQVRRERVLRGYTPEVLKLHLEYSKQAIEKRSPRWSTFPY